MGHMPAPSRGDVQVFTLPAGTTVPLSNQTVGVWTSWTKPRGIIMVHILCIGGGGGGGKGFTRAAGSPGGGGGGGAAAPMSTLLIPAHFVPDTLFVQVGRGGLGVSAGIGAGGSGIESVVALSPANTIVLQNLLLRSCNNVAPGGGGTGTAGSAGAGGGAGSASVITNMTAAGPGVFSAYSATAGATGGSQAGANGASTSIVNTGSICCSGAGGAGTTSGNFAGGGVTAIANCLVSQARPIAPAAGSNPGSSGVALGPPGYPLFFFGGCGGSSSNTGVGGDGGNGIVIITAW